MIRFETKFSCAHFYHQKAWSLQQNQETFGKCFTEYGHGHDYCLQTVWQGPSTDEIQQALTLLKERLDHQHLNFVIPEFTEQIPTTENLALYCQTFLCQRTQGLVSLRLYETPSIWVEWTL